MLGNEWAEAVGTVEVRWFVAIATDGFGSEEKLLQREAGGRSFDPSLQE